MVCNVFFKKFCCQSKQIELLSENIGPIAMSDYLTIQSLHFDTMMYLNVENHRFLQMIIYFHFRELNKFCWRFHFSFAIPHIPSRLNESVHSIEAIDHLIVICLLFCCFVIGTFILTMHSSFSDDLKLFRVLQKGHNYVMINVLI